MPVRADTAIGAGGTPLTGLYGTLTLKSDGDYVYAIDEAKVAVERLRASANTLTDTFVYLARDPSGATDSATLTITIQGQNDDPTAQDDYGVAREGLTGPPVLAAQTATGNVLVNDTDKDGEHFNCNYVGRERYSIRMKLFVIER